VVTDYYGSGKTIASEGNLKRFENIVKDLLSKKGRDLKAAEDLRGKLEGVSLSIKKKAGVDGRLFGSVTPKDIFDAVKDTFGVEIDKKNVKIDEPIKMTGSYTVSIHLQQGVNTTVKVEVEQE